MPVKWLDILKYLVFHSEMTVSNNLPLYKILIMETSSLQVGSLK